SRLIHIGEDTRDPLPQPFLVKRGPPCSHFLRGEVGKRACAGPTRARENRPIRLLQEITIGDTLLVYPKTGINFDVGGNVYNDVDSLLAKIHNHALGIGEARSIPRENPEPIHVVDINKDGVAGNPPMAKVFRNEADGALGKVTVTALNVSY